MPFGSAVNASHMNGGDHSMLGVIGSLGTADIQGTALTLSPGINPLTGAMYVDVGTSGGGGGASGTFNNISSGTQQTLGTVGTVTGVGTISNIGTIGTILGFSSGTFVNISTGTINSLAIRTTSLGTVGTVADGAQGTMRLDGNNALYMNNAYKLDSINDSVTVVFSTGGTVILGTLTNLVSGTINALAAGTITTGTVSVTTGTMVLNTGTITTIAAGTQNTLGTVGVVNNLVSGTLLSSGTTTGVGVVTSVTNLVGGTVQRSSVPVQLGTSFVTVGTTGAAVWGTIQAASGAGTKQYVSRTSIVVVSGTVDVAVTNIGIGGSTGAGVLERGQFPAGGGITNNYDPVMVSGTNGTLSYWLGGAGTVDITVNYWNGV